MQFKVTYNYNKVNQNFSEKRLLFFAQAPGGPRGPKKPPTPPTPAATSPEKKDERLTDPNLQYLNAIKGVQLEDIDDPHPDIKGRKKKIGPSDPEKIAALYESGKLEGDCLMDLSKMIADPNMMNRKECRYFVKALANGQIPGKARFIRKFVNSLNTLEKDGDEQAHLEKLFRRLSDPSTGPLTEKKTDEELDKLPILREKDIAEKTPTSTSSKTALVAETADVHSAVEQVTGRIENAKTRKPPHLESIIPEMPKEIPTMRASLRQDYKLANKMTDEIEEKERELKGLFASKDKTKIKAVQEEIKKRRVELRKIHRKIDLAYDRLSEKETEFNKKALARYRAVEFEAQECGLNLMQINRLKVWGLDLAKAKKDGSSSLDIKGYVADKSGKAGKRMSEIKIKSVEFDNKDEEEEFATDTSDFAAKLDKIHNDEARRAAGAIWVTYEDEQGNRSTTGILDFINIVNALEAYDEIETFEDLDEAVADANGEKAVEKGDVLSTKLPGMPTLKVVDVDRRKKTIVLEDPLHPGRPLKKLQRDKLSAATPNSLYFDRYQREFSLGEFARFIKNNGYARKMAPQELPKAIEAGKARLKKKAASYMDGVTDPEALATYAALQEPETTFTPPKNPGESKEVFLLDDDGQLRKLRLTYDPANGDEEPYEAEEIRLQNTGTDGPDLEQMIAAGYPMRIAGAHQAKTISPQWKKRRLATKNLAQLSNNGALADADMLAMQNQMAAPPTDVAPEPTPQPPPEEKPPEAGPSQPPKQKGYAEALPYDAVHKVGGMSQPESSYLKAVWSSTRFLSSMDIWEMCKAGWEYYDRRHQRRQKDRYSSVGVQLPFFAPEMRRINQTAETEQVNQFKESFEQKGVLEIWDRLNNTTTRDEMKACFIVLASKGMIRWDDISTWEALNRFVSPDKAIPIPANRDPDTIVSEPKPGESAKTGKDFLKAAIDSLWGEGQYNDWYSQSKSTYQSNAQKYYEEGKELEGVQGGHGRRLATLLRQHKDGVFVDPQEYEGLILHSIMAGKAIMQEKIYFMIQGVAAQNSDGRTILSFDRMAHINSEMLVRFPILEYLCADVPRPPDGKSHRFTLDDYREWGSYFDDGDPSRCTPSRKVDQFMWEKVIPSDETQNRINKALRNAEMNMDHDDMFAYLPPCSVEVLTDTCRAATGSKKFLTIEGYANAFPGFSQYLLSCSETGKLNKLREGIKSYVRFEGIMRGRYEKQDKGYQRMESQTLKTATICSNTPPMAFIDQISTSVGKIVEAYGDDELTRLYNLTQTETPNFGVSAADNDLQKKVDLSFKQFNDVFDRVVKSDNGATMASIVAGSGFEGMPWGMTAEEKAKRKAAFADATNLESGGAGIAKIR